MAVNVLDPELPFLASQAAIELDSILNGTGSESSAVHNLAKKLKDSLESASATTNYHALLADTATISVLGQAININLAAKQQQPISTVDELSKLTADIADQLSKVNKASSTTGSAELEWARAFCLALSRCSAAYRRSEFEIKR